MRIEQAIAAMKRGDMIIVTDDDDRENEGDLIMAAEHMTEEAMAFFIRHTGGVVCLALSNEIADQLALPAMVKENTSTYHTNFTVSIEAAQGVTTGISAADRAQTVQTAIAPDAAPTDLHRPGHIFPLRAQDGGVLWRGGHTEAAVDFCKLAGIRAGAVISELMHEDGTMMRGDSLTAFAKEHDIVQVSIAELIAYRHKHENFIRLEAATELETETGVWHMRVYTDLLHHTEHVALIKGTITIAPTLVRVHSECMTGDILGSKHCDCGPQRDKAMQDIAQAGSGVFLYMEQEGRGIGLVNKIKAYALQRDKGLDTYEANKALGFPEDLREYGIGAQILADCGVKKVLLMTNNPKKMKGIEGYGLEIVDQVPIEIKPNGVNNAYLSAKKDNGHRLSIQNT